MLVLNEHLAVKLNFFVNNLSKSWVRVVRTMILCDALNHLRRVNNCLVINEAKLTLVMP